MQKPNSENAGGSRKPEPLTNTGIASLNPRTRLAAYLRQTRAQKLKNQICPERRFGPAIETRRRFPSKPRLGQPRAERALFRALDEAAARLVRHLNHTDASAIIGHLDRLAPDWCGGRREQERSGQAGA